MGFPLNRNAKVSLSSAFVFNNDRYSPTNSFSIGDVLDKTVFRGSRSTLAFEQKTFDKKQYATRGRNLLFGIDYFAGTEFYTPGNVYNNTVVFNKINQTRHVREWVRLKISDENYVFHRGKYTLGYLAEAVISNQPLFSNYYSTLLATPAFYPLQDSKSIFLEKLRATSYLAGGLKNVIGIRRHLDLRLEGYLFLPHRQFEQTGFQNIVRADPFRNWHYAATANLVYHTPVGPISLSYNMYDDPVKRTGVLLHLGYLIYNKRSIE